MKSPLRLLLILPLLVGLSANAQSPLPEPMPTPAPVEDRLPEAVITEMSGNPVAENYPLGEPIYFSARQSIVGTGKPVWLVEPASRAERAREVENGMTLVLGTGQVPLSEVTVLLAVAKGDRVSVTKVRFSVGNGQPKPTPDPQPGPGPKPEPSGDYEAIKSLSQPFLATLPQKKAVSGVWKKVADKIQAGTVSTEEDLLKATVEGMVQAIGYNDFQPYLAWREKFTAWLKTRSAKDVKSLESVWRDVAKVLGE